MSTIPASAAADLAAALDIYRVLTPPDRNSPAEAAEYALAFLSAAGWCITPDVGPEGVSR